MAIGMGIGAFAEGLAGGMQLGLSIKKMGEEDALKSDLKAAQTETTEKYGNEVTDESLAYMGRKSAAALMKAGQHDKAREFLKWSEESDTKANTRQFAAGLRQIDMGDLDSFDKTLGKLGAAKGYGPEIGVGFARGDDGKIISNKGGDGETYYRLKVTPPGAKEPVLQDVPASRLKDTYARWFNPLTAYESEKSQSADKSKRDADITDYERKKKIDTQYADPERSKKERVEAIDSLRKRETGGKAFDDLPDTDKETAIQKEIGLRRGTSASVPPAGPSVVMDRATGQPVRTGSSASAAQTPGGDQDQPSTSAASAGIPSRRIASAGQGSISPGLSGARQQASDQDISALEGELAGLDQQINETRARSRNPEAATMLLGPLETKRSDAANRLMLARESRLPPRGPAIPSPQPKYAEISSIDAAISQLRARGGGYDRDIAQMEERKRQLLEEANASNRGLMQQQSSSQAPGLMSQRPF